MEANKYPNTALEYRQKIYEKFFLANVRRLAYQHNESIIAAWLGFTKKQQLLAFITSPSVLAARTMIRPYRKHSNRDKLWRSFIRGVLYPDPRRPPDAIAAWTQAACKVIQEWDDCPIPKDSLHAFHAVFCLFRWVDGQEEKKGDGWVPKCQGEMDTIKELNELAHGV